MTRRDQDLAAMLFAAAICLASLGGIAFWIALRIAFTPGQHGGNGLAIIGLVLLVASAVANLIVSAWGSVVLLRTRHLAWWFPLSLLATIGAVYCGWIAINL